MAKKNNDPVLRERIDWLAVAIGNLGNITGTARKLGVTEKLICDWLDKGLESVPFGMVAKLSEKGDVPLGCGRPSTIPPSAPRKSASRASVRTPARRVARSTTPQCTRQC